MKRAATPDSNAPNSFDEPIKIPLIAETRPRISSGVVNCKIVERSTTDTLSNTPEVNSAPTESHRDFDSAKTIIATPNPATAESRIRPALRLIGWRAKYKPIKIAPQAGAARSRPSVSGPLCNTFLTKAGSKAIAPPNSTANMSKASAANKMGCEKTKRKPCAIPEKIKATLCLLCAFGASVASLGTPSKPINAAVAHISVAPYAHVR